MQAPCRFLVAIAIAGLCYSPRHLLAQQLEHLPPLHGEALSFDAARGRIVLVGGSNPEGWLTGTWEWDGQSWFQAADSSRSPSPRVGHAMQFDPDRGRVLLFGGMFAPPFKLLCDTWVLHAGTWSSFTGDPCPTDRVRNTSLIYHTGLRSILLAEGPAIGNDTILRPLRLWRWADSTWVLVDSTGPRRLGFSAIAYDEARGRLVVPVLFGGPDAGVWEWNGAGWRREGEPLPGTRQTYSLTYDPERQRVVLLAGQGSGRGPYLDDGWTWDGRMWSPLPVEQPHPSGRGGATLLADPRNRRLLLFGGYDSLPLPELWVHDHHGWHRTGTR